MKTLNKNITSTFFTSPTGFTDLHTRWSEAVNDPTLKKTLSAEHHALYAILRGKDWTKNFTEITNASKLLSGQSKRITIYNVLCRLNYALKHSVFVGVKNLIFDFVEKTNYDSNSYVESKVATISQVSLA